MFTSSSVRRARSVATELEVSPPFAACKRSGKPVFLAPRPGIQEPNRSTKKGVLAMKSTPKRKGLLLVGGVFGAGIATVVVSAFTLFAGAGVAASKAKPQVVNPPSVSGTPQEGKTLTGDRGDWNNNPTDYDYAWLRCGNTGGSCAVISAAHRDEVHADVGRRREHVALPRGREELRRQDDGDVGADGGDPEGGRAADNDAHAAARTVARRATRSRSRRCRCRRSSSSTSSSRTRGF